MRFSTWPALVLLTSVNLIYYYDPGKELDPSRWLEVIVAIVAVAISWVMYCAELDVQGD